MSVLYVIVLLFSCFLFAFPTNNAVSSEIEVAEDGEGSVVIELIPLLTQSTLRNGYQLVDPAEPGPSATAEAAETRSESISSLSSSLDTVSDSEDDKILELISASKTGKKRAVLALLGLNKMESVLRVPPRYNYDAETLRSALMLAIVNDNKSIVKILLNIPNLDINDEVIYAAIGTARENGLDDMLRIILKDERIDFKHELLRNLSLRLKMRAYTDRALDKIGYVDGDDDTFWNDYM